MLRLDDTRSCGSSSTLRVCRERRSPPRRRHVWPLVGDELPAVLLDLPLELLEHQVDRGANVGDASRARMTGPFVKMVASTT